MVYSLSNDTTLLALNKTWSHHNHLTYTPKVDPKKIEERKIKNLRKEYAEKQLELDEINNKIKKYESSKYTRAIRDAGSCIGIMDSIDELIEQKLVIESRLGQLKSSAFKGSSMKC